MLRTFTLIALSAVLAGPATWSQAAAQSTQAVPAGSWGRAKANAAVRNFGDANGAELTRLSAGHVVRIQSTNAGVPAYHEVEVAGGVPVWVWGELLQPTAVDGVVRVDASHVNMRPYPESSPRSMALRSKLQRGDRLLVVERQNPARPLSEDWVRVWSPESARVWIAASDVQAVTDPTALAGAQEDWLAAQRKIPTQRQAERARERERSATLEARAEARAELPEVPPAALQALSEANRQFDAVLKVAEPGADDWLPVLSLYEQAAELAPAESATAQAAAVRLREVELRLGLAEVRERMRLEDARRRAELEELARASAKDELQRTVLRGRYQGRGWLESRVIGGERKYFVVWSGETTAEVRCSSGRYDLSMFEGFEVGLIGSAVSPAVAATATTEALPRVLDAYRIEVLSASARR